MQLAALRLSLGPCRNSYPVCGATDRARALVASVVMPSMHQYRVKDCEGSVHLVSLGKKETGQRCLDQVSSIPCTRSCMNVIIWHLSECMYTYVRTYNYSRTPQRSSVYIYSRALFHFLEMQMRVYTHGGKVLRTGWSCRLHVWDAGWWPVLNQCTPGIQCRRALCVNTLLQRWPRGHLRACTFKMDTLFIIARMLCLCAQVCGVLQLLEKEYFSLQYSGKHGERLWVNLRNPLHEQLPQGVSTLDLRVKFFVKPQRLIQPLSK